MRCPSLTLLALLVSGCTPSTPSTPPTSPPNLSPPSLSPAPAATTSSPAGAAPTLPGSPAGELMRDLVQAINAGDPTAIGRFLEERFEPSTFRRGIERMKARLSEDVKRWQGLTVLRVEEMSPEELAVRVKAKGGDEFNLMVRVDPAPPHRGVGFAVFMGEPPPPPQPKVAEGELPAALGAYVDKRVAEDRFSGTVLVAKQGKPVFTKAVGFADAEGKVPNTLEGRFNIASMGKMFTAVAVAQLVEAGKIKFDDPVGKYLPQLPKETGAKVTLRHCLTHRGGLGNIFNDKFPALRTKLTSVDAYLALFADEPLRFEPGTRFDYSNGGFIVLGAVVEKVTGRRFYDHVRDRIFAPAGMASTGYPLHTDPGIVRGYTREDDPQGGKGPRRVNTDTLPARGSPAGGGYSTVGDLLRFAEALSKNTLIKPETAAQLFGSGGADGYGMGFGVEGEGARRWVGHTGGAPGVSSELRMYRDSGLVIVVLSNFDPPASMGVGAPAEDMIFGPASPAKRPSP